MAGDASAVAARLLGQHCWHQTLWRSESHSDLAVDVCCACAGRRTRVTDKLQVRLAGHGPHFLSPEPQAEQHYLHPGVEERCRHA